MKSVKLAENSHRLRCETIFNQNLREKLAEVPLLKRDIIKDRNKIMAIDVETAKNKVRDRGAK